MVASKLTRPVGNSRVLTEAAFMTTLTQDEQAPNAQLPVFEGGASHAVFLQLREASAQLIEEVDNCTEVPNPHPCRNAVLLAAIFIRITNNAHLDNPHFSVDNLR